MEDPWNEAVSPHIRCVKGIYVGDENGFAIYRSSYVTKKGEIVETKWLSHYYPLVDLQMNRADTRRELDALGIPYLISSECAGCPHADPWRWLRRSEKTIEDLSVLEKSFNGEYFFTKELRPLKDVIAEYRIKRDQQHSLFDDVADFINFGVHPGLWIWITSGSTWLTGIYVFSIFARLVRFTLLKQDASSTFSGLPSPAAALGVFGLVFILPEPRVFLIGVLFFALLSLSSVRCMHVMKQGILFKYRFAIILFVLFMPFIFGYDKMGIGMTHLVLLSIYLLFSIIFLLPFYARD